MEGTLVTLDDITGLKVPVSMVCIGQPEASSSTIGGDHDADFRSENDQLFPDEVREEGKAYLETNKIEHEIKVYPNVPHGKLSHRQKFCVRPTVLQDMPAR